MPIKKGSVLGVSEVAFWVKDVEEATAFYVDTLGFETVEIDPGHNAFLTSGDLLLVLFTPDSPNTKLANEYLARTGGPLGDMYHIALRVAPKALDGIGEDLRSDGLPVKGPVDFPGGRRSYFLEDLDAHYIELTDR